MDNWLDEMIERESTPKALRAETTRDFCAKRGIPESTYYFEVNKKENQLKIIEICLRLAKKYLPEVMENLGERATKDNKATELFMEYVLEKSKNIDIKTDGKPISNESVLDKVLTAYANNLRREDSSNQGDIQ